LNFVIKAGETKAISVMASMSANTSKVNRLGIVEVDASSTVE
jgi:hypothetical protein